MIPGNDDMIEGHRQFAGVFHRTHQDRPARFEYQLLDDLFRLVFMRLDRNNRQILEPRARRDSWRDSRRGKPLKSLVVDYADAICRNVECLQQDMRIRYAARFLDRRRIIQIDSGHDARPHQNILFDRHGRNPGADIPGDRGAFFDSRDRRRTWLTDKRQKDILDRHVRSPLDLTIGACMQAIVDLHQGASEGALPAVAAHLSPPFRPSLPPRANLAKPFGSRAFEACPRNLTLTEVKTGRPSWYIRS